MTQTTSAPSPLTLSFFGNADFQPNPYLGHLDEIGWARVTRLTGVHKGTVQGYTIDVKHCTHRDIELEFPDEPADIQCTVTVYDGTHSETPVKEQRVTSGDRRFHFTLKRREVAVIALGTGTAQAKHVIFGEPPRRG